MLTVAKVRKLLTYSAVPAECQTHWGLSKFGDSEIDGSEILEILHWKYDSCAKCALTEFYVFFHTFLSRLRFQLKASHGEDLARFPHNFARILLEEVGDVGRAVEFASETQDDFPQRKLESEV